MSSVGEVAHYVEDVGEVTVDRSGQSDRNVDEETQHWKSQRKQYVLRKVNYSKTGEWKYERKKEQKMETACSPKMWYPLATC